MILESNDAFLFTTCTCYQDIRLVVALLDKKGDFLNAPRASERLQALGHYYNSDNGRGSESKNNAKAQAALIFTAAFP